MNNQNENKTKEDTRQFYKVTRQSGVPYWFIPNPGVTFYSLPYGNKPGHWMPPKKEKICWKNGYHLCLFNRLEFFVDNRSEIYEAEYKGASIFGDMNGGELAARQVRLTKKLPYDGFEFFKEIISQAMVLSGYSHNDTVLLFDHSVEIEKRKKAATSFKQKRENKKYKLSSPETLIDAAFRLLYPNPKLWWDVHFLIVMGSLEVPDEEKKDIWEEFHNRLFQHLYPKE